MPLIREVTRPFGKPALIFPAARGFPSAAADEPAARHDREGFYPDEGKIRL
jgi:hypothetical protein